MGDLSSDVMKSDDAICVGGFDFHTGGAVKAAALKSIHDSRKTAISGAYHVPADVHIFADQVAVIIGESPDATSGGEQAVPFISGELAAVETTDGRVENFHPEVVLPLGEIFEAAVIEVLHPVGMIDDGESAGLIDVVDDLLTIFDWLDECFCADVQKMWTVAGDFITGDQDQAAIIDFCVVFALGDDVMITDHEKIVAGIGVFVDDVLNGRLTVARRGVRVEIAAQ